MQTFDNSINISTELLKVLKVIYSFSTEELLKVLPESVSKRENEYKCVFDIQQDVQFQVQINYKDDLNYRSTNISILDVRRGVTMNGTIPCILALGTYAANKSEPSIICNYSQSKEFMVRYHSLTENPAYTNVSTDGNSLRMNRIKYYEIDDIFDEGAVFQHSIMHEFDPNSILLLQKMVTVGDYISTKCNSNKILVSADEDKLDGLLDSLLKIDVVSKFISLYEGTEWS
ncbi:hypothetical protein EJP02_089 [Escherichia phage EJP2]|nr:hypothetical protein EJP02_089 [Escherichia phage EJP2]